MISTTCPDCPVIVTCQNVLGCDGFNIWSGALVNLFPEASYYSIRVPYLIQPTRPNARRRLLAIASVTVDGGVASDGSFILAKAWFTGAIETSIETEPDCDGGFSCKSQLSKAAIILIPILSLAILVICCVKAKAKSPSC